MPSPLDQPSWHDPSRDVAVSLSAPTVQRWLDAYVAAWRSYDERDIADLWSIDAVWHYPFEIRATGRASIVEEWLRERDAFADEQFDARYHPVAIDRDVAVAHGRTVFLAADGDEVVTAYDNIWFLRFDADGRCSEFHEWYAGRPEDEPDRAVPSR
ncbi:hypothetical protein GCM10009846_23920 [Agrococcus versicolor]|uniref:SnoaL-like domain-containing protein n=1 Tax=Agrococcus versicolor TaxID=501482 RepID=A0ABN3AUY2_9MICO